MSDHLTESQANAVYDLLVQHAGASEHWREDFVMRQLEGCREYRFMGTLGSGGKFWCERDRWRVSCYPEDETPECLAVVEKVNGLLSALRGAV